MRPGASIALVRAGEGDPGCLTRSETARLATFGHADRRRSFVLGRTAARHLLASQLGVAPGAVAIQIGSDGAPRIADSPLWLSISHAGRGAETAAAAAVAERRVGLDLEAIRPRRADLWTRILRPDEHATLDALGGPTDETQTLLWSLKEAVLKGRRTGFRAGARSVQITRLDMAGDAATGEARDDEGGVWHLAVQRRGDLWVSLALLAR